MNILSINIRGVGCEVKRDWIRGLRLQLRPSFLAIQETKSVEVIGKLDKLLWGNSIFSCEVSDPEGQSGGIATLWDPNIFLKQNLSRIDGCLAIGGIWVPAKKRCWVLNIYAPQLLCRKKALWSAITGMMEKEPDAWWFCAGDFNAVRSSEERLGSNFCQNTAFHFNNFIHEAGLAELSMGGRRFTYMSSDCGKHSKLDRFLVSYGALDNWPELKVTALNRLYSDHCPILLSSGRIDFGPTPFRFYNRWLLDPAIYKLVLEVWIGCGSLSFAGSLSPLSVLAGKLKHVKVKIREWRAKVSESENRETAVIKKKIEDIDLHAEDGPLRAELVKERSDALQRLKTIEAGRILDLKQKARTKWALEGDENSRFFHGVLNQHRRAQKINGLLIGGHWITSPALLKNEAIKHFSKRFSETSTRRPKFSCSGFSKLTDEQKRNLEDPITLEELKLAVWSCGANKAPGPDGFSLEFFRKFWDIIKADLLMAVKQFERSGRIDRGCNASFITLVPKVLDPSTLDNYRPISLIGSLYKIISKILAERLKKVISSVVSRVQTAFIAGRTIFDGPLILNETISWLRKTKSKAFIFKVDFEKAFDCLNWEFLDSTLEQMNFGMIWRSWIRGCLSSASVSVLLNGSPTAEFRMARGLRQGDPLAPFLFILAAEALHQAMETAKEKGVFYGIQLPNRGPCISHLQYADDAVFIGAWSKQNARNLIRILRCYELASGLRVNLCKSKFFGVSCSPVELDTLARGFNCGTGSFPFSYLGLPIGVPMGRTVFWNALIEKFRSRLSKWKAASLSFGGRLTLCKSVLGGLGSYFFSIYRAPEKVLEELERIRMRFFWGADVGKKKMTWIAWKKTLASKEKGGLGIGSLGLYCGSSVFLSEVGFAIY